MKKVWPHTSRTKLPKNLKPVVDYSLRDLRKIKNYGEKLLPVGFQATEIGRAVKLIRRMKRENCTIFFSFTANMVASGLRGIFKEIVKRKFVDVIITTGGSIEHDVIRCFAPYFLGDFNMDDVKLHETGINRLGNILVPTERYILFEEKIVNILSDVYEKSKVVSPRELIDEIGAHIKCKDSILYWAHKNKIPIFCPGITDSALGYQFFFFKQEHKDFVVDVTKDMNELADIVFSAKKTGGIILGGGISKHHVIGVNIIRGGLDYAVYVTTATPYDGSLSGAEPKEAKSWGKIKEVGKTVVVHGDATVIFPLIIAPFL
ncbi:MAG TPA: deoxyhypusine synthase [Candidatus Aenigmarchaeota archaeon]|nr:deoxyhypusine synthase [Candidatus Aenigmarchaeota archaeon]